MSPMKEAAEDWQNYLRHCEGAVQLKHRLLNGSPKYLGGFLKQALDSPQHRLYALEFAVQLQTEQKKELLPELLAIASHVGPHIFRARDLILSLPIEWLLGNIERVASPILDSGDEESYRRILELYAKLDGDLTRKLAERAASSSNEEVRAVGIEFLG